MLFDDFLELIVFLTNMFVWLEKKIKAVNWKIKYYLLFNMAATGITVAGLLKFWNKSLKIFLRILN